MKILLIASEAVPFCKTGGLADVVGALSQRLGPHEVCLFLPRYRGIGAPSLQEGRSHCLRVPLGSESLEAHLRVGPWRGVSVCFIDYPPFYDREGLYGRGGKDHPDNDRRFILLSRGALEGARVLGFKPEVVHAHDWQAALACAYLKRLYRGDPFFSGTGCLLTIHNMAYQGNFPRESLAAAGFGLEEFTPEGFEYHGSFSFLKAGILSADLINTVSPTYAREIQESEERGFGMAGLLRARSRDLSGILNGIDPEAWDPRKDLFLPRPYGPAEAAQGKAACKRRLQEECRLRADPRIPLIAVVSRLDHQKGLDLAIQALEPRLGRCQLAVLGTGDPALEAAFAGLGRRSGVHFHAGFDEPFAHRLYAAADIFLMPSRFEPCGLGQMIAMRYGCLVVASRTGGLADTVRESPREGPPSGFLSAPGDPQDLGRALDRALEAYARPAWLEGARAAMESDFSWEASVSSYLGLYQRASRGLAFLK